MLSLANQVEEYRNIRGLSISDLCEGIIDNSTYSRFRSGQIMIRADIFLQLLYRMGLSFQEMSKFSSPIYLINEYRALIEKLIADQDHEQLLQVNKRLQKHIKYKFDTYHILAIQVQIKLHEWGKYEFQADLKEFVFNAEDWIHNEIYIFSMILDQYDTETVYHIIKRLVAKHDDYFNVEKNLNLIRLLHCGVLYFIKQENLNYAEECYQDLTKYLQTIGFNSMRFYMMMDRALLDIIKYQTPESFAHLKRIYELFNMIDKTYYTNHLKAKYEELRIRFNLPVIDFEKKTE